jgi:hypothetical protein
MIVFSLVDFPANAPAADPLPDVPPARSMGQLVRMSRCELETLYRGATVGCPPSGVTDGRAIFNPGSRGTVLKSRLTSLLWQGKVIQGDIMINRVLGLRAVRARVYVADSWFDGKPTVVFDYNGTSKLFANVRDEVREVAPGLYLGLTYVTRDTGPELTNFFTLATHRR